MLTVYGFLYRGTEPSTPLFSAAVSPTSISTTSSPSPSLSHTSFSSQPKFSLAPSMISTTPPLAEPINVQQPSCADSDAFVESEIASIIGLADVDPQIIEALKSKDRIYVLKLGEQMESLINDRRYVFLSLWLRTASLHIKYCVTLSRRSYLCFSS